MESHKKKLLRQHCFREFHFISQEERHCQQGLCQDLANVALEVYATKIKESKDWFLLCKQVMLFCSTRHTNGKLDSS